MQTPTTQPLSTFLFNTSQLFIKILIILRVNYALKYALACTPPGIRAWVERRKPNRSVIRKKLVPEKPLTSKYQECLSLLLEMDGADTLGDYLEFGVFQGTSMICMHRVLQNLGLDHVRMFGFDSFEGLPDSAASDDKGVWQPGQYKSSLEFTQKVLSAAGVNWNKLTLVKGWFNHTLTDDLIKKHNITKASVIMVDCDLYSSTKDVLNFCTPLIQDKAIILFDDWNSYGLAEQNLGEKRAFDEFLNENPCFSTKDLGSYNNNSKIFLISRN